MTETINQVRPTKRAPLLRQERITRATVRGILLVGVLIVFLLVALDRDVSGTSDGLIRRMVTNGFVAGVAANIVVLLLAVGVVDTLLRRAQDREKQVEEAEWIRVRDNVDARIRLFATGAASGLRIALGAFVAWDWFPDATAEPAQQQLEVVRKTAETLLPNLRANIESLRQADWRGVFNNIVDLDKRIDPLLRFERWAGPERYELLLQLQDQAQMVMSFYTLVPQAYAQPDEFPVPDSVRAMALGDRKHFLDGAATRLAQILTDLRSLMEHSVST